MIKNIKITNTTVAISPKDNNRLTNFCNRYEIQKKEFIKIALDYFEKNGIDPRTNVESKSELEKIIKRIDQLFGFIKTQEKDYLRPSVQAIIATELRLKEKLNSLATIDELKQLPNKNFMQNFRNDIQNRASEILEIQNKSLEKIGNNVVASHQKITKELEEIKNKRGISF